jgi:hypothetical protein
MAIRLQMFEKILYNQTTSGDRRIDPKHRWQEFLLILTGNRWMRMIELTVE